VVGGKSTVGRSGLLAAGDHDLKKMVRKQEKLSYQCRKLMEE
jgi:hypothetical protein